MGLRRRGVFIHGGTHGAQRVRRAARTGGLRRHTIQDVAGERGWAGGGACASSRIGTTEWGTCRARPPTGAGPTHTNE